MSLLARFSRIRVRITRATFAEKLNYLTWVVLKAHTRNRAGEVTLRSTDPRDTPLINFHYFQRGRGRGSGGGSGRHPVRAPA